MKRRPAEVLSTQDPPMDSTREQTAPQADEEPMKSEIQRIRSELAEQNRELSTALELLRLEPNRMVRVDSSELSLFHALTQIDPPARPTSTVQPCTWQGKRC
ncbi:MAG TPA: hypothetical protein VGJ84_12955 [Polyangiaceae bacterium]